MKTKFYTNCRFFVLALLTAVVSCKKENHFLDAKPQLGIEIPTSLTDLQKLLHNEGVFNRNYPSLGELASDDYYVSTSRWSGQDPYFQNAYIWSKTLVDPNNIDHAWQDCYSQVYNANTVLDYLPKVPNTNQTLFNQIKGTALFYRSIAFFNLLTIYASPYDPGTAASDLGIPLRLTSDLNAKSTRANQAQCYHQIIADLQEASTLLSSQVADITSPSKVSAFGLLSRIYLSNGDFANCLSMAKSALAINSTLQDFNKLDPNAFPVYPNFSPEELFHAGMEGNGFIGFQAQVDSTILKSFSDQNDLRPSLFFYNDNGQMEFNSQFDINNNVTFSISNNEIYLNKAECEARSGDIQQAINDLNTLLIQRWKTGTFIPFLASNADDALNKILKERRKELLFTGLRWIDLRRLNKDSRFAITIYRNINGKTYSLPPNDPRYVFPIPQTEIQLTGEQQNLR